MLKELNKELQQSEVQFFPPGGPWFCFPTQGTRRARHIFLFVGSQASLFYFLFLVVRRFFLGAALAIEAPPPPLGPGPGPVFPLP